jgi:hypothetical protein
LLANLEKAEERRRLRKEERRGEEGVGYDSFLAIELRPEPSILKGLSWRNYNEEISSVLGDSVPPTAIRENISDWETRRN